MIVKQEATMQEILEYIQEQRYVTARALRFKFGITGHKAGAILSRLHREGKLEKVSKSVRKTLYLNPHQGAKRVSR